jgi:serine/threonine protein kinase
LAQYQYCIVMPAADRSVKAIIDSEHIAGRDWDAIRNIAVQMIKALGHVHEKGLIHGDFKPLNLMRIGDKIKLIDFDASVRIGEISCLKWSSAYLPPECIFLDNDVDDVDVSVRCPGSVPDDQLVHARPSHDMRRCGKQTAMTTSTGTIYCSCTTGVVRSRVRVANQAARPQVPVSTCASGCWRKSWIHWRATSWASFS